MKKLNILGGLKQLISNRQGQLDESALAFLIGLLILSIGAFIKAFHQSFPLSEYSYSLGGIVVLYKAANGDWRANPTNNMPPFNGPIGGNPNFGGNIPENFYQNPRYNNPQSGNSQIPSLINSQE